jgi:hypothetical protein
MTMKAFKLILTIVAALGAQVVFSAPPPPPTGGPTCWPPPCIPIDGGILFLMIAGALYGLKKIYDSRRKSQLSS